MIDPHHSDVLLLILPSKDQTVHFDIPIHPCLCLCPHHSDIYFLPSKNETVFYVSPFPIHPRIAVVAQLDDLCIDIWVFVMITTQITKRRGTAMFPIHPRIAERLPSHNIQEKLIF